MKKRYFISAYRIIVALIVFIAVCVSFQRHFDLREGTLNFFSYFTYQSCLYAIAVLLLGAKIKLQNKNENVLNMWRGASVVYMSITGAVYTLLLRGPDLTAVPWANDTMHYIFPLIILADWFYDLPKRKVSFKKGLIWTAYPFAYLFYTLIRGPIAHWYPYPFIDPTKIGYWSVVLTSLEILIATLILIYILTYATNYYEKKVKPVPKLESDIAQSK